MPGGNLLALAQGPLPGRHVVVVDFRRRRHRRIGEAHHRGVELEAADHVERVGGLVEGDRVLGLCSEVADHDRGERVGALQPHEMAGEEIDAQDVGAGPVRHQFAPLGAIRRGERRGDDLEIDGAAFVGEDEELFAAVGHAVAHALLARRDQPWRRVGQ